MSVKTYSLKTDGNTKLSTNFTVKEFKCNDGSDTILIDIDNVTQLQKIRTHFGKAVNITSGYRTVSYNTKVGGASDSYHTKGQAADIVVSGVDALKVYLYADSIGLKGIIYYPNDKFCHIDTRATNYRAISVNKVCYAEPTNTLKRGCSGGSVRWMQYMLTYAGYKLTTDGIFGTGTETCVKTFQKKYGLTVDGMFGAKSRAKLKEVLM